MFMRQASRIAINRTVAGVHFPVDSVAGAVLGLTLAKFLYALCAHDHELNGWNFIGLEYPADQDFDWSLLYDVVNEHQQPVDDWLEEVSSNIASDAQHSEPLEWLWKKALKEWRVLPDPYPEDA
jgi:hypothetical protein